MSTQLFLETNRRVYSYEVHRRKPVDRDIYSETPGMQLLNFHLRKFTTPNSYIYEDPDLISIYDLHTINYEYYV